MGNSLWFPLLLGALALLSFVSVIRGLASGQIAHGFKEITRDGKPVAFWSSIGLEVAVVLLLSWLLYGFYNGIYSVS